MISLALNVTPPLPTCLYTAVNSTVAPGVRPVSSSVTLARTGFFACQSKRIRIQSNAAVKADMKPAEVALPLAELEPLTSAVRITSTFPEVGMTADTYGPPSSGV